MLRSNSFGRIFWVDDNLDLQSCPQNIDGTGDFDCSDYVTEWDDWSEVDVSILLNIQKSCIHNKLNYAGSLSLTEG